METIIGPPSFIIIWEIIVQLLEIPTWLLPSPSNIFHRSYLHWLTSFIRHLMSTIRLTLLVFSSVACIGFIMADHFTFTTNCT